MLNRTDSTIGSWTYNQVSQTFIKRTKMGRRTLSLTLVPFSTEITHHLSRLVMRSAYKLAVISKKGSFKGFLMVALRITINIVKYNNNNNNNNNHSKNISI